MPNYTTELDLLKAVTSGDGNSDTLKVDTSGSSAPSGAATSAKQDTGNTSLGSIDTKLSSQATATKQDTGNTSLATLVTQTDGIEGSLSSIDTKLSSQSTATKQDTGNTSLSSIDTKLSSQATAAKQDTGNTSLSSIDSKITTANTAATLLNDVSASGTIHNSGDYVQIDCTGLGTVHAYIDNLKTGAHATDAIYFYASMDGVTFFPVLAANTDASAYQGQIPYQATGNGADIQGYGNSFKFSVGGYRYLRLKADTNNIGTYTVYLRGNASNSVIESIHDIVLVRADYTTVLPLPTGASTETTVAKLTLAQASTTAAQTGPLVQGATTTAAPSYTTAKTNPLSLDTAGNLRVSLGGTAANSNKLLVTADAVTFASPQHIIADSGTITTVTNVVHVDDNSGALTVDNAGTFAVQATVASGGLASGSVASGALASGSVSSGAIASGAFASGSVASGAIASGALASGSISAGAVAAGSSSFVKLEDVASADADAGVPAMAILKATPADTAGTDGDYQMLQMKSGRLWVSANNDQINGVTPLMGNGTTGTGSQRVTIASDNTAFAVNATLQTGSAQIGHLEANQSVNNAQIAGATTAVNNGTASTGCQRVTIASDNTAFSVNATPPTLTKGTQGSTGFSVQPLSDAGRTHINFYASGAASGTTGTETAITLTKSSGTAATSTGTSFVVTNGKTYRITSMTFGTRGNSTGTAEITTFVLRINTGGAVITSSTPVTLSARSGAAATALAYDRISLNIADGYEIVGDGTLQFGITANSVFSTNAPTWDVLITGFEY